MTDQLDDSNQLGDESYEQNDISQNNLNQSDSQRGNTEDQQNNDNLIQSRPEHRLNFSEAIKSSEIEQDSDMQQKNNRIVVSSMPQPQDPYGIRVEETGSVDEKQYRQFSKKHQGNDTDSRQSGRSSRQGSIAPGSFVVTMTEQEQQLYTLIMNNDHKNLQKYLAQNRQNLNLVDMIESRGYTLLAFCAFKNHSNCFMTVFQHALKYNLNMYIDPKVRSQALKKWADTPTDERFTALHFASYHGNMKVIRVLLEQIDADYYLQNCYGANVLHISAQGDQPAPLFYYINEKKMEINCIDKRGSTPLHWACYSKSEYALSFIIALNPKLDAQDNLGFTPLHLAIRSVGVDDSTRSVRSLLLKGAKRSIRNYEGQKCEEMIKENIDQSVTKDLQKILEEPTYVECCMTKTPMVQLKRNHKTQSLFLILFIVLVCSQIFIIVPNQKHTRFAYAISVVSIILLISFTVATVSDPGYLKPEHDFQDLLDQVHPCELCPDCRVLRTPRSKHCAICNRCVERFDHHCPWINSCVGIKNHNSFLVFIISLIVVLILIIASSIVTLLDECHPEIEPNGTEENQCVMHDICLGCKIIWLRCVVLAFTVLVSLFFGAPSSALCVIHIKNYSKGLTTNERYAKKTRTPSMGSSSNSDETTSLVSLEDDGRGDRVGKPAKRGCFYNCHKMCFKKQIVSQQELLDMHLEDGSEMDSRADSFASEAGNVHNSQELRLLD